MSGFADYSREQLRRSYVDAWAKARAGTPLAPLEALIADVIAMHPQYQARLADPDGALAFDPVAGEAENPFLHMGLHIAVREQLAVDRPPGIREIHRRAMAARGDSHGAEHLLVEALERTLWEAQRAGRAPDEQQYLAHARSALAG